MVNSNKLNVFVNKIKKMRKNEKNNLKFCHPIKDLIIDILNNSNATNQSKSDISIGIKSFDDFFNGWNNSDLIVLAGRPGKGKTSLALNICLNSAVNLNNSIAYFTLNESAMEIAYKLFAIATKLSLHNINQQQLNEEFKTKIKTLSKAPIYIEDSTFLSLNELENKIHNLKNKHNIDMFIIDDIHQIIHNDDSLNKTQIKEHIAMTLKQIAIDLNVPILVLSKLSNNVEFEGGCKIPLLKHLRHSEKIDAYADSIILMYRPEYYGFTEDENGFSINGLTELFIVKHNNGIPGKVCLRFRRENLGFYNWVSEYDCIINETF